MFGYLQPDLSLMDEDQKSRSRSYYCGVCHSLKERAGDLSRLLLSYDPVFLACLLDSLYEEAPVQIPSERCLAHPLKEHPYQTGPWIDLAADLDVLLSFHKLSDDIADGDKAGSRVKSRLLHGVYEKTRTIRPREDELILRALKEQAEAESDPGCGIDFASSPTSHLLAELYAPYEDVFREDLMALGSSVGSFVYLSDAFDDLDRDASSGCFNPLLPLRGRSDLTDYVRELLVSYMADAVAAFEALPVVRNADLIRNVLYSGVWTRFSELMRRRGKRT